MKLLCLVKTKIDIVRTHLFCNTLTKHWDWAGIPSMDLSGGIIVLWRRDLGSVTVVANSRFVLHLVISSNNIVLEKLSGISSLNLP